MTSSTENKRNSLNEGMMNQENEFTLGQLAEVTDSRLVGDPNYTISGYADLESASECDVSFLSNPRYTDTRYVNAMKNSLAGAIFIAPSIKITEDRNYLINEDPSWGSSKAHIL